MAKFLDYSGLQYFWENKLKPFFSFKDTNAVQGNVAMFDENGNTVDGNAPADNLAQKDGNYPLMSVGTAKNLDGNVDVEGKLMYRATATAKDDEGVISGEEVASGQARLSKVAGQSVVWNQILRTASITSQSGADVELTKDGNKIVLNGLCNETYDFIYSSVKKNFIVGHKYALIHRGSSKVRAAVHANGTFPQFQANATVFLTISSLNSNNFYIEVVNGENYSNDFVYINIIDLTLMFGAGKEPATVAEFEAWLEQNIGLQSYYPYNESQVLGVNMTGIATKGYNLFDLDTNTAKLLGYYDTGNYGNWYGIYGTFTSASYVTDDGEEVELDLIEEDTGIYKFQVDKPGTLTLTGASGDVSVFMWYDGSKIEYEPYEKNTADFDVKKVYGKLNGAGDYVQVFPNGMQGIGDAKDTIDLANAAAVAAIGKVDLGQMDWTVIDAANNQYYIQINNIIQGQQYSAIRCKAYATSSTVGRSMLVNKQVCQNSSGDVSTNVIVIQDSAFAGYTADQVRTALSGVPLFYELATSKSYTDLVIADSAESANAGQGTAVEELSYIVDNWGTEELIPQNTEEAVVTVAPICITNYDIDAVEAINTINDTLETLDAEKADKSGEYLDMSVGSAKALEGANPTIAEFTERKTGGSASVASGLARLNAVHGKTLVWNQQVHNGTFESTTGWDAINGTISASENVLSFTYGGSGEGAVYYSRNYVPTVNHKYLICGYINSSSRARFICGHGASYATGITEIEVVQSLENTMSKTYIYFSPQSGNNMNTFFIRRSNDFAIKNVVLYDLTLMFGAGNEPSTVEEFEALYPLDYYSYNAGQLISNAASGLETIGFNQWDEEWEVGSIDITTGEPTSHTSKIRSKNFIPALGNTSYYIRDGKSSNDIRWFILFYDGGNNYLGCNGVSGIKNTTFTTPANCRFIKFREEASNYGTAYNNDICINLSEPSKNGQYEPYKRTVIELNLATRTGKLNGEGDSVVVFPDGLRSAGAVHDEIVGNGAIKRMKKINLEDLDWIWSGGGYWYSENIADAKFFGTSEPQNIICSNRLPCLGYQAITYASGHIGEIAFYQIAVGTENVVVPSADSVNKPEGILIYELATPEEYVLDTAIPTGYQEDGDGVERRLPVDGSNAVLAPFAASITYPIDAVNQLLNMPQNYGTIETLDAFCASLASTLSTALNGTFTITRGDFDAATNKYSFNISFTPNT